MIIAITLATAIHTITATVMMMTMMTMIAIQRVQLLLITVMFAKNVITDVTIDIINAAITLVIVLTTLLAQHVTTNHSL